MEQYAALFALARICRKILCVLSADVHEREPKSYAPAREKGPQDRCHQTGRTGAVPGVRVTRRIQLRFQ